MADDKQKIEIEIAVRDSMSTFLKTASQALESFNRELIKTGASGQTSLEEIRKRFQSLDEQGKKTGSSFGGLGNVFGGISKSILGPVGVVAGFAAVGRSLDQFAVSSLRLSNFAKDFGLTVAEVNRASQQAARAAIDPEKATANLAKAASSLKEMYVNPESQNLNMLRRMNAPLAENVLRLESQGKTMEGLQKIRESYFRASGPDAERYRAQLREMFGGEISYWESTKDEMKGVAPLWVANEAAAREYHRALTDIETTLSNLKKMFLTGLFVSGPTVLGMATKGSGLKIEAPADEPAWMKFFYSFRGAARLYKGAAQGITGGAKKLFGMEAGAAEAEGGGGLLEQGDAALPPGAGPIAFTQESLNIEEDTNKTLHDIRDTLTKMEERAGGGPRTRTASLGGGGAGAGDGGVAPTPLGATPPMGRLQPPSGGPPTPVGGAPSIPFAPPVLGGAPLPTGIASALEPTPFAQRFGGMAPVGVGPSGLGATITGAGIGFPQLTPSRGFPGAAVSGAVPIPSAAAPGGAPDEFPAAITAIGGADPKAFIVHHTGGRGTVAGVQATLRGRGLGVQYVMDREGKIHVVGGPGASHMKSGWGPKGEGLSNRNVVGMEIIAKDDKDVTVAQREAARRFIQQRYPNTPVYGHGEVNPGHREAREGMTVVDAIRAERERGGTAIASPWPTAPAPSTFSQRFGEWGGSSETPGTAATPGPLQRGKMTWFGTTPGWMDPNQPPSTGGGRQTATGTPFSVPGIALPPGNAPGQMHEVTLPDGRTVWLRQTDVGPPGVVDVTSGGAAAMGFTPKTFPEGRVTARRGELPIPPERPREIINEALTRGDGGGSKEATVNGKVTFGEAAAGSKKSAFETGADPLVDIPLSRTAQAGQAGSVANSFSNRFAFE